MKKCGKKHIENRSGIACCGADYPFGPSGSFRDIVSVPELRPMCRTSGKRLAVSQCAVLPACRPAVCRFAVRCLLLPFLCAERPGSVPPYPNVLCCPHVVRPFADSPWGAFCCRSCAPNVREASLRIPMRCAVRVSSGRLPIRRGVPFAVVLAHRTSGKRLAVSQCAVLPACRLRDVPPYAAPSFGSVLGAVLSRTAVNQKCSKPSKRRRCRSPRSSQTGPDCPSCEWVMRPTG